MDPDLNKYDLNHACTGHPLMSQDEWEAAYRIAWETYYTDEHVEPVLRRAAATKTSASARPCSCSTGSSARSGSRRSTRSRPASCA